MKEPLEKEIQKSIIDYLALLGCWRIRINSGAMSGNHKGKRWFMRFNDQPGCPDVIACLEGRFIAIEIKRPGGKLTEKQASALEAIRRAGGLAFVATGIRDVEAVLKIEGII